MTTDFLKFLGDSDTIEGFRSFLNILLGGLVGSVITALLALNIQNRLAHARRTEQEKRYAYFSFVSVCRRRVALEFVGAIFADKLKPIFTQLEDEVLPKLQTILMSDDHSLTELICAFFAAVGRDNLAFVARSVKHMDTDFIFNSEQMKTHLESPDQIINLPKAVIAAYSSYGIRAQDFSIKNRNLMKVISGDDPSLLTTQIVFDFVQAFKRYATENKGLYDAFIKEGCVTTKDAKTLYARTLSELKDATSGVENQKKRLGAASESANLLWEMLKKGGNLSEEDILHYLKLAASRGSEEAKAALEEYERKKANSQPIS